MGETRELITVAVCDVRVFDFCWSRVLRAEDLRLELEYSPNPDRPVVRMVRGRLSI